jgi:hypothetical protein
MLVQQFNCCTNIRLGGSLKGTVPFSLHENRNSPPFSPVPPFPFFLFTHKIYCQ